MYGIFTYICLEYTVNLGQYSSHREHLGSIFWAHLRLTLFPSLSLAKVQLLAGDLRVAMFLLLTKKISGIFRVATTHLHPSPTFPVALSHRGEGPSLGDWDPHRGLELEGLRTRERHAEDTTGCWQLNLFFDCSPPNIGERWNLYFDGRIFCKGVQVETTNRCFFCWATLSVGVFLKYFWYHGISPSYSHLGDFFVGDFKKSRGGRVDSRNHQDDSRQTKAGNLAKVMSV